MDLLNHKWIKIQCIRASISPSRISETFQHWSLKMRITKLMSKSPKCFSLMKKSGCCIEMMTASPIKFSKAHGFDILFLPLITFKGLCLITMADVRRNRSDFVSFYFMMTNYYSSKMYFNCNVSHYMFSTIQKASSIHYGK